MSLIGSPNVGKSTLINNIIGEKVSIVTHKKQTTRSVLKGIFVKNQTQTTQKLRSVTKFEKKSVE